MENLQAYLAAAGGLIFVATAKEEQPSLRIMGFGVDEQQPNVWYLVTQPGTAKLDDLAVNSQVAIMTPLNEQGMRIESNQAKLVRSNKTWADVKDYFHYPVFFKNHPHPEEEVLLELHLSSVRLADYQSSQDLTFD
ncbi:pyridoxamine 5'-phosphate oxidase family protein [Leuconostocaceae bacterium ESL0958]|nr:pyridoxamine 5'-phosphate oxidase family protein [Leuconostocaceae bacterium ESL0958]